MASVRMVPGRRIVGTFTRRSDFLSAAPLRLMHLLSTRLHLLALPALMILPAFAVPVAVNDSFTTPEDTPVSGNSNSTPILVTNFESSAGGFVLPSSWDYLDTLLASTAGGNNTYPVDGESVSWKAAGFEKSTSTVAGWKTDTLPIQGGGVDAWPAAPNLLAGIAGGGGVNTVNTYLFRTTFTMTATEAAQAYAARVLADDGCIIYINGIEAGRLNYPTDVPVNPDALVGGNGGSETNYTNVALTVPFVAGTNCIAIELHQNANNSSDAGIDLSLVLASADPLQGLAYADNVDGTNRGNGANGDLDSATGNPGTSINVQLSRGFGGGGSGNFVSGGWRKTVTVPAAGTLRIACDARARAVNGLEDNEYAEAIVMLNGARLSLSGRNYLVRQTGANPAGSPGGNGNADSGWANYVIETPVTAGSHVITFGGYGTRPSAENFDFDEGGLVNFDNIDVSIPGTGGSLLDNDTGAAAPVTAVKASDPAHGTVTVQSNGFFTYTPAANYFGTDSFTYRAVDGSGESNAATVTITVTPVNDPPVAVNDGPYSTIQGAPVTIDPVEGLLINDTDVESSPLTAAIATGSANGTVQLNADGSFTFTPAAGFSGTATFTYRASDGTAQSAPATVTVTAADIPDAPVAANDSYTALRNTPLTVSATTAGSTTEEILPYKAAGWHYFDSLVPAERNLGASWRTEEYVETDAWKTGPAELGYGDGDEGAEVADNPDPAFNSGAGDKFASYYFRKAVEIPNHHTITGVEISVLYDDAAAFYLNGVNGWRTSNLPDLATMPELAWDFFPSTNVADNSTQTFNLPPATLREGSNLIAAQVHQNGAASSDLSFDLRLRVTRAIPAGVLANDTDFDAGQTATLTVAVVSPPANGSVTLNANGTFTYTPAGNFTGTDSFTYRATDSTSLTSNTATVSVTVIQGPNVAPTTVPDSFFTQEDTPLSVIKAVNGVLANDTDAEGDPFTAVILAPPSHGQLTLNPNGTFDYIPALNFNGVDSFTYRAVDTKPGAPATVTITVEPVNDAPASLADSYAGDPGVPLVISAAQGVLANDSDADAGTTLTAALVSGPSGGSLTLNADGSFIFSAPAGGSYSFTYTASDGTAASSPAIVTVALNAVPVTLPETYSVDEDQPLSPPVGVLANDSDPEAQPLTAVLALNVQHGVLTLNADGTFSYQPASNFHGADSFAYRATDGVRTSAPVTVSLTVNPVNDAPVGAADIYSVRVDTPLTVEPQNGVLRNDTDVDNGSLTALLVSPPEDGELILNANGSFTYTPVTGFSGVRSFTYRASDGSLQSAVITVTLNVTAAQDTVMISEVMYNPPGAAGVLEEFVEVYNFGDAAVDLSGWRFTNGVNYEFPAGTLLAGKAYLAIPANTAAFAAKYPGATNVVATGWGLGSALANGGETLRLKNAADVTVDEVSYSDSGDWATRKIVNVWDATNTPGRTPANGLDTDPGLEWVTAADPDVEIGNAGGASIQLVNTALSNKAGQNWAAAAPTPGAANAGVVQTNSAPLIRDVAHYPPVPNRTEQVYVTARLTDELLTGYTASVFYRIWLPNGTTPASAFAEVIMADNGLRGDGLAGDGVFGAVIPAQVVNNVVEFYVRAQDAGGNARTWPAPTLDLNGANPAQNANCLYQVNEETWTDHRPLYQLVLTGADNAAFNAGLGDRQSNVAPNATVIFRQGGKFDIRYRSSIRTRGNSSRSDTPMNLRMDIPGDAPWNGRTAFTLNYKYSYSQFLASRLFECAGVPCEKAGVVGMRLNGANRLLDANGVRTFGYYCDLLPRGGDTIKEWFPDNDDGNGYGKIRGNVRWGVSTLPVIGANGWAEGGYVNEGYNKQTNAVQNDWTDLHAWMQSLNAGTAETFHTTIANTVDIDQWCRFLAMSTIVNHGETNMANGDDDDYSVYFSAQDKLCRIIAHDLDTCFNLRAVGLGDEDAPATVTIYQCTDPSYIDNATLPQMDKFYRNPVTGRKFKAALRHYLDTVFAKPRFDATVDELLDSQWMGTQFTPNGDAIRAHIKAFMDTRRTTIETFLPRTFTAATSLTVQNGYPRTTSATDLGSLGGKIDPARTAEVRVNDVKVTTNPYGSTAAADNSWSAGTAITLQPGLNNLVCTAHDESGSVFASQSVTIWYDAAGANRSGTLASNEIWTAAGGPYNVTASLTVPSGVELVIEPGTTVFVAPGAGISVSGGGRLVAAGTATAGITFMSNPGASGTWNGIVISGATAQPSRLSYVTFANNGDTSVHARNGANVELDHLTFLNAGVPFIEVDASSFRISDCMFPDSTAGFEPVHGSGGIASGGRGIIERCVFGKTQGYNDTIDFTGGNRPGPVLHVLNCTFAGSDDDILDLDSTDAWIEGNVFLHAHRNGASPDSSSAVSGGSDNADYSQVTVINNFFYDCDNAVTMKQGNQPNGGSGVLLYNTIVRTTKAGGIDTGSGVVNFDDENVNGEGKGFYLEGNIIWDAESLTRNYDSALSQLTLVNNVLPAAPPAGAAASGNMLTDPLLNLSLITAPATATAAQVIAALTPQGCSPALHLGARYGRSTLRVPLPPASVWPSSISLTAGPAGSFTPMGQPGWTYGFTHYRYSLDGGAESEEAAISSPLALTGLTPGAHVLRIRGRRDTGEWQEAPLEIPFTSVAQPLTVSLSEVLADSQTAQDMIELHNWGATPVNLNGCTLSDDLLLPGKFAFDAAAVIPAGGYLAVDATQLGFSLNRSGETVRLYAGGTQLDEVTFGPQITGMSIARTLSGWTLATPTAGVANTGACELGSGALVRINEWLGNNDLISGEDFVELYNAEGKPVNLAAWRVSQDFRNSPLANSFPPLSFIPASGFLKLIADGDRDAGYDHLDFKVSSIHDSLTILDASGGVMDHVFVRPGNPDVAQGRITDGGNLAGYLTLPTPGFSNGSDLSADSAVMNGLRITEIMFDPPGTGAEYIELRNIGGSPLTVDNVRFSSGITFTFPAQSIPAGGYAVITGDLVRFAQQYPAVTAVQWTSGRLDNNGEMIRLETGTYGLGILDFRYEGDWYPETRSGASLEIVNASAARSSWSDAASWQPCVPSPGGPSAFGVLAPADLTSVAGDTVILQGFVCPGAYSSAAISVAWTKVSGPGTVNFSAPANRITDVIFSAAGTYELLLTATPPGGDPSVSDSVTVTITPNFETYAQWTARTLAAYAPAQQTADADADADGVPNGVEHVLGTDPAMPTPGPELIVSGGHLALRYTVSRNIDPAIQVIPQISDTTANWQEGSAVILDFLQSQNAAAFTRVAEDVGTLGAAARRMMRLKVVIP